MCPWQLLLGKEVLQAALLILKVRVTLPAPTRPLPHPCRNHLHRTSSSRPSPKPDCFGALWCFLATVLSTSKEHSTIRHKQLRGEVSFPLQFRCPVTDFCWYSAKDPQHTVGDKCKRIPWIIYTLIFQTISITSGYVKHNGWHKPTAQRGDLALFMNLPAYICSRED